MEDKKIKVSFLELTLKKDIGKINEWFPKLEKTIGRSLPQYSRLEGGVYPDSDGVMHRWETSHYYMCIPTEFLHLLKDYGTFSYSINKEVDDSMFNNLHCIFYWGPGCDPYLQPIPITNPNKNPYRDDGDY